jgi:uncharacterized protein YcfL
MNRFYLAALVLLAACSSAESPALRECRTVQENIILRTSQLDSTLIVELTLLREQSVTMSTDSLLASDSLLRMKYSRLKESSSQLEYKQAELHSWRDHLILLPATEEIALGIRNPFGEGAGDAGILQTLNSYSDTLSIIESSISELIRTTTHERTSTPQPQE